MSHPAIFGGGPLFSLGLQIHRRRYFVLIIWAVLLLGALPLAPRITRLLQPGGLSSHRLESQRAAAELRRALGYNPASVVVVFTNDEFGVDDPRWTAAEQTGLANVRVLPEVAEVTTREQNPRQTAPDGRASYAVISLKSEAEEFRTALPRVKGALQPTDLDTVVTGAPVFYADILDVTERDLRRAELISVPFAAVALLLVFGSVVAAAVPAAIGGAAVLLTLGLMVLLAQVIDLSVFALNLVTMLGLGLGIDYSLFIVSRFREELSAGFRADEAVARATATAGRAVLFSGLTVFVGLLGLTSFEYMALRSMGVAGSLVVLLSVLAALTLLPALLGVLGPRVNALAIRPRGASRLTPRGGFWAGLAERVMRRPGLVFAAVLAFLLALGSPFLRVELGAPDASVLPRDVQSRQGFDLLRQHFGEGEQAPVLINVSASDSIFSAASIDALYDYVAELRRDPRVAGVESLVSLDPRITREQYRLIYAPAAASGSAQSIVEPFARAVATQTSRQDFTLVRVTSRYSQTAPESKDLVRRIRTLGIGAGLSVLVGGGTAGIVDYSDGLYRDFPRVLVFIVVSTYLILFALLRSVLLPLKAILMNTLSLLASYGALVLVFQEGWLSHVFGVQPVGFVEASLPIIMFCVLFGLSMDYEVFLLARVKEAYDEGRDNRGSVAAGLERSGRIITSAALIIVLVSGSFAAADIVLIKALGLGTAIAVLLDATVVRALLVPATMRLLGDWNWWVPGWGLTARAELLPRLLLCLLMPTTLLGCARARGDVVLLPAPSQAQPAAYEPIRFPRDEAPHDMLTEWWYYTGHLQAAEGQRYGFELVIFQTVRGDYPVTYLAQFAITDRARGAFQHASRVARGSQIGSVPEAGFNLSVEDWRMRGALGRDELHASMDDYSLSLVLSTQKPAVLHDGDGLVSFGAAGDSYYYSYTRLVVQGTLVDHGKPTAVVGQAWFDHQWGNFLVLGGGWDWFSAQLDDGSDLMLNHLRDDQDRVVGVWGTYIDPTGRFRDLRETDFAIEPTGSWTSPKTGAAYPMGWRVSLREPAYELRFTPVLFDQELVSEEGGLTYWEGASEIEGTRAGEPVTGLGYVELTGYARR